MEKTAERRQECADSLSLYLSDDASVQNLKCHWGTVVKRRMKKK